MSLSRDILLDGGELRFWPAFFDASDADTHRKSLIETTPWETHAIRMFGRTLSAPRLSSWHGDAHCSYAYSGVRYSPKIWTPALTEVRAALLKGGLGDFNCVLANFYRSGVDSMGWHSDDELELGAKPMIASVSLGVARRFCLRHKISGAREELLLTHGSVLVMAGDTQRNWQHALPKMASVGQPRVNLTFRNIAAPGF